ncbi:hypothetical protein DLM76_17160 [Leptospira yasudae]|uniref:hypothetical protein n=1 Tax=Leptospira yasudae TaxID=2202201 RepID=UPI000E5A0067|nr:hypothetical protein [Leptospira yasudae]RHX91456.1 hypothetical protein DLM76_17160 [Leptospira yasudae]
MTLDLKTARKLLANLSTSTSPDSSYRIEFLHIKAAMTFSIKKLSIPNNLPSGVYKAEVFEVTDEGEKSLSNFEFNVPNKEEAGEEIKLPVLQNAESQSSKDPNLSILLELRKQDQVSHEKDRELWEVKLSSLRSTFEAEIKRLNESHKAEIDRINKDWEYKLEITKNNQLLLETERIKLTKAIESRVRGELKSGSSSEGIDLNKALENPIVLSVIGKVLGLEIPNIPGAGGGFDLSALAPMIKSVMGSMADSGKGGLLELLGKEV